MTRGSERSVLVLATGAETDGIGSALADRSVTVTLLSEPNDVFDELIDGVYDSLLLPATVADRSGTDLACGIRKLFPELPIVVAGADPAAVPEDLDVRAIAPPAEREAVVEAVVATLEGDRPSVAGRPPSPLETLLRSLFDEMPHHLYAKDERARHVLMGRGFNEPTSRIGLTDPEVSELADEHAEAAYRDELEILNVETDRIEVEEFLDLDASYVKTVKAPWYGEQGDIEGLVGLTQDITERKRRTHELRRQHERMVTVALVVAHEFRNALQVARGRLELLDVDEAKAATIDDALARIDSLVDTVVELSTAEREPQERKPVWLSRLSREVWDSLEDSGATLRIESDTRVVADQESASLLLQFLFRNALEHGGADVTVTVGTTAAGFYVANDGAGIAAEPPERVFDAGFTTGSKNTGFGLYIAQSIADEQGWSLTLTDAADGSVRFDIEGVALDE